MNATDLLTSLDHLDAPQLRRLLVEHLTQKKLGLTWEANAIERDAALNANLVLPSLQPDWSHWPEGDKPAEHLVIEGDNFDALRLLNATHRGKVRVIYIDPPYNTGNKDWVYNDRYVGANDRWRHSQWLEFLYRRLVLARDLLTSDGVILVSINDENRARLELLMDEVFPGRKVGSLVWKKRKSSNTALDFHYSSDHEHVLIYAGQNFAFNGSKKTWDGYQNWDESKKNWWSSGPLTLGFTKDQRPNLFYPLYNPATEIWYPCDPKRVWVYASKTRLGDKKVRTQPMERMIADGLINFPDEPTPAFYATEAELQTAIGQGNAPPYLTGASELSFWVGKKIAFGRPRFKRFKDSLVNESMPLSLIKSLLAQASRPGDIVLDFFAGSGTTGQAVLELNAEDGGARRFILCSSTEATTKEPEKNLCRDVCAERLRRVMCGYGDKPALGGQFAYLQLDLTEPADLPFDATPAHAFYLLALRLLGAVPPAPTFAGAPFLPLGQAGDCALLIVPAVTPDAIDALIEWRTQQSIDRLALWSPRPESLAATLAARGIAANCYSLLEALERGQGGQT